MRWEPRRVAVLAALVAVATSGPGLSFQGGPDAGGYVYEGTTYDFVDLSDGLGTPLGLDSNSYADVTLPWSFPFYGASYGTLSVSGMGGANFQASAGFNYPSVVGCIPSSDSTSGIPDIAALYHQYNYGGGFGPETWTWHDTVEDRFIVSWEGVENTCNYGDPLAVQAHLFPDGRIEFHYEDVTAGSFGGGGCNSFVGIQNATAGTHLAGEALSVVCSEELLDDGDAVAFLPPSVGAMLEVCASGCPYSDVPAALAAAGDGDTVSLGAGTWPGCFAVPDLVTLQGAGATPGDVVIDGTCSASTTNPGVDLLGGNLANLRVEGAHTAVRASPGGTAVLTGLELRATDVGLLVFDTATAVGTDLDIRGADAGVSVDPNADATLRSIIVVGTSTSASGIASTGTLHLENATVVTDTGASPLGRGIRTTGGEAWIESVVVAGWNRGAWSGIADSLVYAGAFYANPGGHLTGTLAEGPGTASLFDVDPLFVAWPCAGAPESCDLHPRSLYGRWDEVTRARDATDAEQSPLVDAGRGVSTRAEDEADLECHRVNLGGYGGITEASLGPPAPLPTAGPDPSSCKAYDPQTGTWWASLHSAVAAAQAGDTLQLADAVIDHTENVDLLEDMTIEPLPPATGKPLLLSRPDTLIANDGVLELASGVTLDRLAFEGGEWVLFADTDVADVTLLDVSVSDYGDYALYGTGITGAWTMAGWGSSDGSEGVALRYRCNSGSPFTLLFEDGTIDAGADALEVEPNCGTNNGAFASVTITGSTLTVDPAYDSNTFLFDAQAPSGELVVASSTFLGGEFHQRVSGSNPASAVDVTVYGSVIGACATGISPSVVLEPALGDLTLLNSVLVASDTPGVGAPIELSGPDYGYTSGGGDATVVNNTFLNGLVDGSQFASFDFSNNYLYSATSPLWSPPSGSPTGSTAYNGYFDDSGAPVLSSEATDASNFACDAGILLTCDLSAPTDWLAPFGSCLQDWGDPSVFDVDGSISDVGAAGGPGAALLLDQFDVDGDGFAGTSDCDDDDVAVFPGAAEVCGDGIDSDCSGGDAPDSDGDGFEDDSDPACPAITDPDCDDGDPSVHPDAAEVTCDGIDQDCDGADSEDGDGDGWLCTGDDCDDTDPTVHPGAAEICDGIDDYCDGSLLAGEGDDDGYGWLACDPDDPDCDDSEPAVYPGAAEVCDGLDSDCDGAAAADEVDDDGDGALACADCDDDDPFNFPGNPEECDGADNDCDGEPETGGEDADGDGVALCGDPADCDDHDASNAPGNLESCDGQDNDCDGEPAIAEADEDGDGVLVCEDDCDDTEPLAFPGNPEVCDGVDNDCDEQTDEGFDSDGDGLTECGGDCDDGDPACGEGVGDCDDFDGDGFRICDGDCDDDRATVSPAAAFDVCDGNDTDCDGALGDGEEDLDGDGWIECEGFFADEAADGVVGTGDCDDLDPDRNPGVEEACDGLDTDCDGFLVAGEEDIDANGVPDCAQAEPPVATPPGETLAAAPGCDLGCAQQADARGGRATPGLLLLVACAARRRRRSWS